MIAMQYSLTLPADYDMSIIDRRIRDKGPLLDGFPNLRFKAYLRAVKDDLASHDNLYAPFYVWDKADGASAFLCGPGFKAIARDFGWPSVKTWIVWQASISSDPTKARFATREFVPIEPHAPLDEIQQHESDRAVGDLGHSNILASVVGFEPTTWTRVRFKLWDTLPETALDTVQAYRVGHVSIGR
jgi:hypothetical protein